MSEVPPMPESAPSPPTPKRDWGRHLDWSLGLGLVAFLAYRFVGVGPGAPLPGQGVEVLPPGDRPAFVELSSTR